MHAATTTKNKRKGWVHYDAACAMCIATITPLRRLVVRHGFRILVLQKSHVASRLRVAIEAWASQVDLLTDDNRSLGTAIRFTAARPLLRRNYDEVSARRNCGNGARRVRSRLDDTNHLRSIWKGEHP